MKIKIFTTMSINLESTMKTKMFTAMSSNNFTEHNYRYKYISRRISDIATKDNELNQILYRRESNNKRFWRVL